MGGEHDSKGNDMPATKRAKPSEPYRNQRSQATVCAVSGPLVPARADRGASRRQVRGKLKKYIICME